MECKMKGGAGLMVQEDWCVLNPVWEKEKNVCILNSVGRFFENWNGLLATVRS